MLGLHIVDWIVIAAYFAAIVGIGLWARKRIRNTSDFYQGGRSFGRVLVAFLNFGNMTDAGQAAGATREIYRQGLSGIWFPNLVLFHTPFQWFIAALQRRARYIGPADMYLHRFESRFLAGLYAAILVALATYGNSFGYLLTGKTLQAMMVKPAVEYTPAEQKSVEMFEEYRELKTLDAITLTDQQKTRLVELEEAENRGELRAFISYLDLDLFYLIYAVIIAAYTVLGGLFAIAIVDVIQGVLIIFLSLALIPSALSLIGGIEGMRATVPQAMFELFGSSASSDYTWYFVAAFAFLNLVVNAPKSFTLGGSPKDDKSARIGFVSGALVKRFMMVGWAFTGLLAIGLYAGQVSDPTNIWGIMTRDLLGAGAIGLMIVAIFSANMDGAATASMEASAAFTKNLYEPLRPGSSERSQVRLGRIVVAIILLGSVFLANRLDDIFVVFKYALSIGTIVGPSFWLVYFWRRLNTRAVAIQMILSIILTIVIPNLVPAIDGLAGDPDLTRQTAERFVDTEARATEQDVLAGKADSIGQNIMKMERIPPTPIYFETVVVNEAGQSVGHDLFRPQIWLMSACGIDFSTWGRSGIMTAALLFDAIVPFLILIIASFFTRQNSEYVLKDFYARIHTPAVADPDLDAQLVREKIENPELVEQDKIFPGTNIEFWKPTRFDIVGFLLCVAFVILIIGLYMLVGAIGL